MKIIVCMEKNKGIMFFNKRVSQDSLLREYLLNLTNGDKFYMSSYSAKQFAGLSGFIVDDEYQTTAGENDYCFIEDGGYDLDKTNEIVLCHWNRRYPADKIFNHDLKANGFKKIRSEDIKGSSHDKITIETYIRK